MFEDHRRHVVGMMGCVCAAGLLGLAGCAGGPGDAGAPGEAAGPTVGAADVPDSGGPGRPGAAEALMPTIVPAELWGSEPEPIPDERRHTPRYITVHHAGVDWQPDDNPLAKLNGLQQWGQRDKGWPDLPYHYLIAPDGRIFEGRPAAYEPETNTDYDVSGHLGVMLWGNFEHQHPTEAQVESAVRTVAWLSARHGIGPGDLATHRDVAETSCPGANLYKYFEDGRFRGWVETALTGQDPAVTLDEPGDLLGRGSP